MNASQEKKTGTDSSIDKYIFADAGDKGFAFILDHPQFQKAALEKRGGLCRHIERGHLVTIVGQGGTGKTILAFQILAHLIENKDEIDLNGEKKIIDPMSFYFSLEASPAEIKAQLIPFQWASRLGIVEGDGPNYDDLELETINLKVLSIPSPADDLSGLIDQIRQIIAPNLHKMKSLKAVVVDPLGGVRLGPDLARDLSRLKTLADSHRTFLFLLVEDYIYNQNPSIEHYSQTIIHLRHNPKDVPCRQLFIQKARGQIFSSGHHQLEIVEDKGISVFPSIAAQSNVAHKHLKKLADDKEDFLRTIITPDDNSVEFYKKSDNEVHSEPVIPKIKPGSTVFLMGPPGTFKQHIAVKFAISDDNTDIENEIKKESKKHCLYISFKADEEAVRRARRNKILAVKRVPYKGKKPGEKDEPTIYFFDARSPVLTPQMVLEVIRREVYHKDRPYTRAVIWGLRRLNDMPNFAGGTAVQFLEALVTLLTASEITSLLIDWPDIEKASTLPIVDLSQYIFLTRICRRRDALEKLNDDEIEMLWPENKKDGPNHVSLIRIQRTPDGFHRDRGAVLSQSVKGVTRIRQFSTNSAFERLWHLAGYRWEQDPSLIQGEDNK